MQERYYLTTPTGRYPLPGTFKPNVLRPTGYTPNLVRPRGSRRVYDLGDGLPEPQPFLLSGPMEAATEAQMSEDLANLRRIVSTSSAIDRDGREPEFLIGASILATPHPDEPENSAKAFVTVAVILQNVPDPARVSRSFF